MKLPRSSFRVYVIMIFQPLLIDIELTKFRVVVLTPVPDKTNNMLMFILLEDEFLYYINRVHVYSYKSKSDGNSLIVINHC